MAEAFAIFDRFMAAYSPSISARMVPDPAAADRYRFEFDYLLARTVEPGNRTLHGRGPQASSPLPRPDVLPPPSTSRTPRCLRPIPTAATWLSRGVLRTGGRVYAPNQRLERRLPTDRLAHQTAIDFLSSTVGDYNTTTSAAAGTLIRQLLPSGAVRLDDVARYLDLHPKALQRKLTAEGVSFEDLVDTTRRETARRLLLDTDMSLDHLLP